MAASLLPADRMTLESIANKAHAFMDKMVVNDVSMAHLVDSYSFDFDLTPFL